MKGNGVWMESSHGARRWGAVAVGAGLGLLELALVRLAGPPGRQVEVLRQLGEVGADPLASLLALLALAAEGLAGYLLAVLGLRLLASVPGAVGQLAAWASVLATPGTVRRALDLLLGGALLAQATLTPLPARAAAMAAALPAPAAAAPPQAAAGRGHPTAALPAAALPQAAAGAAWSRTGPGGRSGAPAPLPPWLAEPPAAGGGGPGLAAEGPGPDGRPEVAGPQRTTRPRPPGPGAASEAGSAHGAGVAGAHTVRPGDTLWAIAAAHLPPAWRSPAIIDRYWRQVYGANRAVVGPDPDLIHPGTRLLVPPYRPDRR
jgi:resuscitation-promoting factor RpfA